ncbi:putative monocarboxylate transporter mch1 [Tulasnella sp. UAMH 9824]|nr:putative monocarboxylate transporter mch1 [Tulasnella sp. UAMH 9824]
MALDSANTSRQITPRLLFKCLCIGGNAITAFGAFTFPIISPDLAEKLQLSQRQLSTIVLAALIGQYPFAAVAGELVDRVGTWACSAIAALVFGIGYGVFAWMAGTHVTPETPLSPLAFRIMVASYFMLGIGEVFSYFSAMFTAAKEFPLHNGLATGITLALFGLSPLFLSLPSDLFLSATGTVDAQSYIIFVGSLATATHFISIFGLRGSPPPLIIIDPPSTDATESSADEETPLLIKPQPEERPGYPQTWLTVLRDGYFWWIFALAGLILGSTSYAQILYFRAGAGFA